jgi:hypothetical protein
LWSPELLQNGRLGQTDSVKVIFGSLDARDIDFDLDDAGVDAIDCGTQSFVEHGFGASGRQTHRTCGDVSSFRRMPERHPPYDLRRRMQRDCRHIGT